MDLKALYEKMYGLPYAELVRRGIVGTPDAEYVPSEYRQDW